MSKLYVSVTPQLKEFLDKNVKELDKKGYVVEDKVDLDWLYKTVLGFNRTVKDSKKVDLNQLMKESHISTYIPAPVPIMSDVERLRLRAEEKSYQKSIESVNLNKTPKEGFSAAFSSSMAMAGSFVFVFIGSFLVGFYGCKTIREDASTTTAMLCGVVAAVLAMLMEIGLLIISDRRAQIQADEEKKKERKKLLWERKLADAARKKEAQDAAATAGASLEDKKAGEGEVKEGEEAAPVECEVEAVPACEGEEGEAPQKGEGEKEASEGSDGEEDGAVRKRK